MFRKKSYPHGTKFGAYFLAKENNTFVIKRMVYTPNGKRSAIRLEKQKYKQYTDIEDLNKLVIRLNGRENRRTIKEIETKLAFLPISLLEEFRELLLTEIPSQKDARNHYKNLHRYCLKFFVDILKLKDPIEWKANENKWGIALLNSDKKYKIYNDNKSRSVKTIKGIIQTANRFMAFLHKKMPQEIPFIKFEPISKAKLKDYNARLNMGTEEVGKFISDSDWELINNNLPADIAPFIKLGYYYGLRRAETLGVELNDLSNGHLNIRRQLTNMNNGKANFSPLKNRLERKTPHWFITPDETYFIIQDAIDKRIHPDTLGVKFAAFMQSMDMTYDLHDLRRTFITKALDINNGNAKPVMMAVGHSNTDITMRYLRDDRLLDDAVFKPHKKVN